MRKIKSLDTHSIGENVSKNQRDLIESLIPENKVRKQLAIERSQQADLSRMIDLSNLPREILAQIKRDPILREKFETAQKPCVSFKNKGGEFDLFRAVKKFIIKQGTPRAFNIGEYNQRIAISQIRKVKSILKNKSKQSTQ